MATHAAALALFTMVSIFLENTFVDEFGIQFGKRRHV